MRSAPRSRSGFAIAGWLARFIVVATIVGIAGRVDAASVTLSWEAPTTNADGTRLTDLASYRIYLGASTPACPGASFFTVTSPTTTPTSGQTLSSRVTALTAGATYFARVTAVDASGNESACSPSASGVAQPDFTVSPSTTTSFGSVAIGSTADRTFTVQNTSSTSLSGTASAAAPYSILSGSPFTLAAGASQTVTVRFRPTTSGIVAGNVNFAAGGDTVSRALSGSGTSSATVTLSVLKNGSGSVTSAPAGINCGTICSQSVTLGAALTLTATPAPGSAFTGWSAPCSGTGTCAVTVKAATTVTATFTVADSEPEPPGAPGVTQLSADATGVTFAFTWTAGAGATSYRAMAAFNDGSALQQGTVTGLSLQLKLPYHSSGAASNGFVCIQSANAIGQTSADQSCAGLTVPARQAPVTLSVVKSGSGSGTVTSAPAGISCGTTCSQSLVPGTTVTLTAVAASGSAFAGWSAPCSGTGTCRVTVTAGVSVKATFNPSLNPLTLSVTKSGSGSGTVTSTPAGIDCGVACSLSLIPGSSVTLTATPAAGSGFTGWGGACTGTGNCTVTMSAAKTVTATFAKFPLTVTTAGVGAGTVRGPGITCMWPAATGRDCTETYAAGAVVTLTATPATGSGFAGWGGACTGTGDCTVTMSAARTVTATFAKFPLTVTTAGAGGGTVRGPGIACVWPAATGRDCTETYAAGTVVTLTATPAAGSRFTGWGGACTGTADCTVTVKAALTVSATFNVASAPLPPSNRLDPPGEVSVALSAVDAIGVTFDFAWTAGAGARSYRYTVAFSDGSAAQKGTVTGLSLQLRVPYHASGLASPAVICIESVNAAGQTNGSRSCAGLAMPPSPGN